ncbi:MAG: hypothetical protein H5T74_11640 [Actinobacteria bacterium]|nr:hypothetical protein [Actinomycetota bacterium]
MVLLEFLKMGAASALDMVGHAGGTLKDLLFSPRYDLGRPWWRRPGLGTMYQIECRPGTDWGRDYRGYNRSMTGPDGRLLLDGLLCKRRNGWS